MPLKFHFKYHKSLVVSPYLFCMLDWVHKGIYPFTSQVKATKRSEKTWGVQGVFLWYSTVKCTSTSVYSYGLKHSSKLKLLNIGIEMEFLSMFIMYCWQFKSCRKLWHLLLINKKPNGSYSVETMFRDFFYDGYNGRNNKSIYICHVSKFRCFYQLVFNFKQIRITSTVFLLITFLLFFK